MLLPANLDDGKKRLGVIFRVLQDVICKKRGTGTKMYLQNKERSQAED